MSETRLTYGNQDMERDWKNGDICVNSPVDNTLHMDQAEENMIKYEI